MSRKNKSKNTEGIKEKYETQTDKEGIDKEIKQVTEDILCECILLTERKKFHLSDLAKMVQQYKDLTKRRKDNELI